MSHHSHRHRHRHRVSSKDKEKSGKSSKVAGDPPIFPVAPPLQPAWSYMALDDSGSFAYDALRQPNGQVLAYRIMQPEVYGNRASAYYPLRG